MERVILCIIISLLVSVICCNLNVISKTAMPVLAVLLCLLSVFGTMELLISTICIFTVLIIIEILFKKDIHKVISEINKKEGPRDPIQITVNCLPATIFVVLYSVVGYRGFLIAFFASIAEVISDSVASDIGVLSKRDPINIITFKPIQKGMSGGISLLGSVAAVLASLFSAAICVLVFNASVWEFVIISISAISGVILDSILGATCQIRYRCQKCGKETEKKTHCMSDTIPIKGVKCLDNCMVNFLCNIWACFFSLLLNLF